MPGTFQLKGIPIPFLPFQESDSQLEVLDKYKLQTLAFDSQHLQCTLTFFWKDYYNKYFSHQFSYVSLFQSSCKSQDDVKSPVPKEMTARHTWDVQTWLPKTTVMLCRVHCTVN